MNHHVFPYVFHGSITHFSTMCSEGQIASLSAFLPPLGGTIRDPRSGLPGSGHKEHLRSLLEVELDGKTTSSDWKIVENRQLDKS